MNEEAHLFRKEIRFIGIIVILFVCVFNGCENHTVEPSPDNRDGNKGEITPTIADYEQTEPDTKEEKEFELTYNFEDNIIGLQSRGGARLEITDQLEKSGGKCLKVSGRTDYWRGARIDLTEHAGTTFTSSAWLLFNDKNADDILTFTVTLQSVRDSGTVFTNVTSSDTQKGHWVYVEATFTVPEDVTQANLYFELNSYCDFYLDDFFITVTKEEEPFDIQSISSLKEVYQEEFCIGTSVTNSVLKLERYNEVIDYQFASITMENEMKPEFILDKNQCQADLSKYMENPALDFSRMKVGLEYAKQHGLKMRGTLLVSDAQMPAWFFTVDYSEDGEIADRDLIRKRMENYIRQVVYFCQEDYPGIITAWDVVSEAINPGDKEENGYRTSSIWYQTMGEEYIFDAFSYARKYTLPGILLFYNDYNTYDKQDYIIKLVEKLKHENLIDGIGMECHVSLNYPSVSKILSTIQNMSKLGLQIHITQLDVAITSDYDEEIGLIEQAKYYKGLFQGMKELVDTKKANITNVTLWGITDNRSYRSEKLPLLFQENLKPKSAFFGAIGEEMIP